MPERAGPQLYPHEKTDWCKARDQWGKSCYRLIKWTAWTSWRAWNEERDGAHRPTRCCDCIAEHFESRRGVT